MNPTIETLSQFEPYKAEKGPNWLRILESLGRAVCVNLDTETVLNAHAASGDTIPAALCCVIPARFPQVISVIPKVSKASGEACSSAFLILLLYRDLLRKCNDVALSLQVNNLHQCIDCLEQISLFAPVGTEI